MDQGFSIPGNEVEEFQFWTLFPSSKVLVATKVFLLGQISVVISDGNPCHSAEKNPSTEIVLTMYCYNDKYHLYSVTGRTSLLRATSVLHINVTEHVSVTNNSISLPL